MFCFYLASCLCCVQGPRLRRPLQCLTAVGFKVAVADFLLVIEITLIGCSVVCNDRHAGAVSGLSAALLIKSRCRKPFERESTANDDSSSSPPPSLRIDAPFWAGGAELACQLGVLRCSLRCVRVHISVLFSVIPLGC